MNDPIFSQMKEQLIPSPAARAALEEGLSRPVRRPVHRCRYWVLAACLLLAAALPLGHALLSPPLHSYVTVEEAAGQEQDASTQEVAPRPGLIISESGLGPDTLPAEEGEPYDLSRLPASAQDGVCPAQQLPSAEGETSSDADTGEGALLLERLTREIQREYGNGTYPDWYGGGYLDSAGDVVVLLVQGCDTQALRSQVRDWAGGRGFLCQGPLLPRLPHQAPGADLCPALSEGGAVLLRPGRGEQPSGPVPHQGRR